MRRPVDILKVGTRSTQASPAALLLSCPIIELEEYYFPRCAVPAALALAPVLFLLFLLPGERSLIGS